MENPFHPKLWEVHDNCMYETDPLHDLGMWHSCTLFTAEGRQVPENTPVKP